MALLLCELLNNADFYFCYVIKHSYLWVLNAQTQMRQLYSGVPELNKFISCDFFFFGRILKVLLVFVTFWSVLSVLSSFYSGKELNSQMWGLICLPLHLVSSVPLSTHSTGVECIKIMLVRSSCTGTMCLSLFYSTLIGSTSTHPTSSSAAANSKHILKHECSL